MGFEEQEGSWKTRVYDGDDGGDHDDGA